MLVFCNLPDDDPSKYEQRMRAQRDGWLAASNWTQLPDNSLTEAQRAAWATYRQALRDAPANWTAGPEWDAPDPPEVV